jgi:predicted MFS family arabinose efflux permease
MDYFGRKTTLLMSVVPLIFGWSSIALAQSHEMILLGRVVCGIAVGLMSAPAQVNVKFNLKQSLKITK